MHEQRRDADHIRNLVRRREVNTLSVTARAVAGTVVVALVSTLIAVAPVGAAVAPTAPVGTAASTATTTNLAPSTVTLTSDLTEIAAGQAATLTAVVDQPLQNTSSVVKIMDLSTGAAIASCSSGTSCIQSVKLNSGDPRSYVATVNSLTSSEVVVSRVPWTIALAIDRTEFQAGESVTLTATTNQNTYYTQNTYRVYIKDLTTGETVQTCYERYGTTTDGGFTCTATMRYNVGSIHEYEAVVASYSDQGANIQATSNKVATQRKPWTIALAIDRTEFQAGESVTLTATTNQNTYYTQNTYRVYIKDLTTGETVQSCYERYGTTTDGGFTCTATMRYNVGSIHEYEAVVASYSDQDANIQATSNKVATQRKPWTIALAIDRTEFQAGESVTLTATTNQNTYYTQNTYRVYIKDLTTGETVQTCYERYGTTTGGGFTCTATMRYNVGSIHEYEAVVASYSDQDANIQATSNKVATQRKPWTIALAIDRTEFQAGESVTLTATTNQNTYYTQNTYRVYIKDLTTGETVQTCYERYGTTTGGGFTCTATMRYNVGSIHEYEAVVASYSDQDANIQATSNKVATQRKPWTISLLSSATATRSGQSITLNAVANQNVYYTQKTYRVYIKDLSTGETVQTCYERYGTTTGGGFTCTATIVVPNGKTHVYGALVAGYDDPTKSIQATSNGFSAPSVGGPTQPNETSGGSNPSQSCSQRCHGDPVNSVTGEFFEDTTDLPSTGSMLFPEWSRSYGVTRAAEGSGLGHGWSSGYDLHLRPSGGDDLATSPWIVVEQENGSAVSFTADGTGGFVAPSRVLATLERSEDGAYRFVRQQSQVFVFDASGVLLRVEDLNGNAVSLSYDEDGRLVSATDSRGGALSLGWADGRIVEVTDQAGHTVSYTYSGAGDLTSVTLPDGSTLAYAYDSAHRITSMTNAAGGLTTNSYDSSSRVTTQTDPLGRAMTFVYATGQTTITDGAGSVTVEKYTDGQVLSETTAYGTAKAATTTFTYTVTNQIATAKDAAGKTTSYAYDAFGNLISTTDPLDRVTTATYNAFGDPLTQTASDGALTSFTYDERGNLLSRTDPDGAVWSFTVNPDGSVASASDPLGRVTTFAYDAAGRLVSSTGPDGAVTAATYNAAGNLTSASDPRQVGAPAGAFTSSYAYDEAGRVLSATDATGAQTTYVYDEAGQLVSATDPGGAATAAEYDLAGQLTASVDAEGGRTVYTYDGAGRVTTLTAPGGGVTTYAYDAAGNRVSVTDPLGRVTRTEYDLLGRPVAIVSPSGAPTSTTYDAAGQVTAVTAPDGSTTTTTYDEAGRVKTVTDADGRAITNTYDAVGRQTLLTRADGSAMAWAYDAAGQLTSATNADGQVTTYGYDAAGNLTSRTTALGTTTLTYDIAGNLASQTAPDGTLTSYTTDAADRVTGIDYPQGTPDVAYTYDAAGRLTSTTDGTGTSTRTYDDLGRLTSETRAGSLVSYEWDVDGNLTALVYPDGTRTTSTYDAAGQLDEVSDPEAGAFDYDWSPDGQVAQIVYPNGVTTALEHDGEGQLTGSSTTDQSGATLLDLAYSYTDAGLLAEQTTTRDQTSVASQYGWDTRGVLDQVTGNLAGDLTITPGGQVTALEDGTTLTYDQTGTLTQTTLAGATTTYTHDARGNRTTSTTPAPDPGASSATTGAAQPADSDPAAVVPVADEQSTDDPTTSEPAPEPTGDTPAPEPTAEPTDEPDAEPSPGDPTTQEPPAGNPNTGEPSAQTQTDVFEWDAANRLTTATVDGVDYAYSYFADGLRATATTGGQQIAFAWATPTTVPRLLTDDAHRYLYGASSTPIAQVDTSGTVQYLHADLIGSIRSVTDHDGAAVAASDYSAYGAEHTVGDTAVSQITAFGYAGEYTDATGLIYLRARYYDPATAQFLSIDALIDLTQTPYGYANGNPLLIVDPLGLWGWKVWEWSADEFDKVSTVLGIAAVVLAATGVGGPAAAVLGGVATAASLAAAAKHAGDGDAGAAALSLVGALPGVGSLAAKGTSAGVRFAAGAATATTRVAKWGPGQTARGWAWGFDRVGDAWTALTAPSAFISPAVSAIMCGPR